MKRIIIAIIIIAVVVVGGYFIYQQLQATNNGAETETAVSDVNTLAIETGLDAVSAEGQIVPLRFANLSFPTSGEVVEIYVAEDDRVTEGDPILRLDTAVEEITLQQASAGLAQAEANLAAAQAGLAASDAGVAAAAVNIRAAEVALALTQAPPTAEQIAVNEALIGVAEANINAATGSQALTVEGASEADLRLAEAQIVAAQAAQKPVQDALGFAHRFKAGEDTIEDITIQYNAATANLNAAELALSELSAGATAAERAAAANAVQAAQSQRDAAKAQLDLLLAGAKPEAVAVAELGVARAEAAKEEAEIRRAQAETAVAQAEAAVTQAEALVSSAQEAIEQRTLTAPFDGTVATLMPDLGEIATSGVPVVTLVDFDQWLVETSDLTELDVVAIANGFPVEIEIDALPGETITGTVIDISRVSDQSLGDVTYLVRIELEEVDDLPLRWGMTANVDIETGGGQ